MPTTKPTSNAKKNIVEQDTFDKATIKVVHELQKLSFCKNISQVEKYLDIGPRKLQQALYGERHIAKAVRGKLLLFFTNNYKVNPRIFSNVAEPVFKSDPPTLEDQPEKYFKKNETNMVSSGDFINMERMRQQLADKDVKIKDLQKEVKYLRSLLERSLAAAAPPNRKTDTKTDKPKKRIRRNHWFYCYCLIEK